MRHLQTHIAAKTLLILFLFLSGKLSAQDDSSLKVLFLYGSRPAVNHLGSERFWFGGMLGGHVGIQIDEDKVIDFGTKKRFHLISHKHNRHSEFHVHTVKGFYEVFDKPADSFKKVSVRVPLTPVQKRKLDSIASVYTSQTPYDYAFLGMRCSAAAYDILAQLGEMPPHTQAGTWLRIFYPRKLRTQLLVKAKAQNWEVISEEGTKRRKWEKDVAETWR